MPQPTSKTFSPSFKFIFDTNVSVVSFPPVDTYPEKNVNVNVNVILNVNTAEPAYNRLQGNREYCLLMKKSTITGIEK